MRLICLLFGLLSLLGMRVYHPVPHDHMVLLGGQAHRAVHWHAHPSEPGLAHSHCEEASAALHHEHWHSHQDDFSTRPQRALPELPDLTVVMKPVTIAILPLAPPVRARFIHPFIPFQTGPPGRHSSRGPPVA